MEMGEFGSLCFTWSISLWCFWLRRRVMKDWAMSQAKKFKGNVKIQSSLESDPTPTLCDDKLAFDKLTNCRSDSYILKKKWKLLHIIPEKPSCLWNVTMNLILQKWHVLGFYSTLTLTIQRGTETPQVKGSIYNTSLHFNAKYKGPAPVV